MSQTSPKPRWWQKSLTKSRFSWKEPVTYLRMKDKHELPQLRRRQPWYLVIFFGLFMSQWWLAKMKGGSNRMPLGQAIAIAFPASALFAYGLPWLVGKCPSQIWIKDRMICRERGKGVWRMEFRNLESFCWIPMQTWTELRLRFRSGRHVSLGVPSGVPRIEVDAFLQEHGLTKMPDSHWSDFEDLALLQSAT